MGMAAEKPADNSEIGMEVICRFAGHLAHEINNLLTPITACSQMLVDGIKPDDPLYFCAEQVAKAGDRFLELSRKLQIIGSKRSAGQVVDLPSLVHEAIKTVTLPSDRKITIVNQTPALDGGSELQIKVDMDQLIFLVGEMINNAVSVMPQGGNIFLSISAQPDDGKHDEIRPENGWIRLTIKDEGTGMSEETQARMYEPYFSSFGKDRDKGLGLTLVYGIVRRSGGWIDCQSSPGSGTTFNMFFPRMLSPGGE